MATTHDATSKTRIAMIGAIANPNVGDEAILEENIRQTEQMFGGNCTIYVFSKDASFTAMTTAGSHVVAVDYLHRITRWSGSKLDAIRAKHRDLLAYKLGSRSVLTYEQIHSIFSSIDVLHIVGGGYLNDKWPDMLEEVRVAAKLAKMYGAKVVATGIGVFPAHGETASILAEIFSSCTSVDFRDDSYLAIEPQTAIDSVRDKIQFTVDDAVFYGKTAPQAWMQYVPEELKKASSGRYANFTMHSNDATKEAALFKELLDWAKPLIERGDLDHVNCLIFHVSEIAPFEELICKSDSPYSACNIINLIGVHPYAAWYVLAHAVCNVGTRFHQAVFSLSNGVPCFSISVDSYYDYKIESIHEVFHSQEWCRVAEYSSSRLSLFWDALETSRANLLACEPEIQVKHAQKLTSLCRALAKYEKDAKRLAALASSDNPKMTTFTYKVEDAVLALPRSVKRHLRKNKKLRAAYQKGKAKVASLKDGQR